MNKLSPSNFYKRCSGIAMVEFAIVLPLLLLLFLGITELGRALYQKNMLTQAVELGGRYLARVEGAVADDCSIEGNAVWPAAVGQATQLIVDGAAPIVPSVTVEDPESRTALEACVFTVYAEAEFQSIFGSNFVSFLDYKIGPILLNAATEERYIGH